MLRYDKQVGRLISKDDYINENLGGLPNVAMLSEIWERMPSQYDIEVDTLRHIKRVNELLLFACQDLLKRAMKHDDSKLVEPEKSAFDNLAPKLNGLVFGSDEYKKSLEELGTALSHHYANNSHHPQHYRDGIDDMDLLDLVEMFFDWCAASERTKDGNIYASINANQERFNMSEQLTNVFRRTASRYYRKNQRHSNV